MFDCEQLVTYDLLAFLLNLPRLAIGEIDTLERLLDVQWPLAPALVGVVPVVYPISGVAILLDFDNQAAAADGVETAARDEKGIACFYRHVEKQIFHSAGAERVAELSGCDRVAEAEIDFGLRRSIGDVPEFALCFATYTRRDIFGRVDLKGQSISAVK
jgi:hypothetical protein